MKKLIEEIRKAKSFILCTHRESDGDGLGAQLALYYALKKAGKPVRILNVDRPSERYEFMDPDHHIQCYEGVHDPIAPTSLTLIFDTNDARLLQPLFSVLSQKCDQIFFIDHHPVLQQGPFPSQGSYIDIKAASTGEITYEIIKQLGIELDRNIAQALYASIAFDTQIFRFIRGSATSHLIAAELLQHNIDPHLIHQKLFGNQSPGKLAFLAHALASIEYHEHGRLAFLRIHESDLKKHNLDIDATKDVIDMIMNTEKIEVAALIRQDGPHTFKVSLRSKGRYEVLPSAERLGGGGHAHSAGAFYKGTYNELRTLLMMTLKEKMKAS